ncbi:kinase-like protein, partial [Aureobasidium melanogenum]
MRSLNYYCDVEAEPLDRYSPGGYHPVHLGDIFNDGRYRVLQKLGFGGFSTVWVARDRLMDRYVALKIVVSRASPDNRESRTLQTLARINKSSHPGCKHIVRLLDDFSHAGPNGTHRCLVFELLGPSVATAIEEIFPDSRLPGVLATRVCKEMLLAVDFLQEQNIGHGDLHTRNIAFTIPSLDSISEEALLDRLGSPRTGLIRAFDEGPLPPGIPRYLVWPADTPADKASLETSIKLIDFGESFLPGNRPQTLHTPLALRAPELLLGHEWDSRVDLWASGCAMFELVVGQPPFSGTMAQKGDIIQQMVHTVGDLPAEWQSSWDSMLKQEPVDEMNYNLEQLLQELYFDDERAADFSRQDLTQLAHLIGKLLRYRPSTRSTAAEILSAPWLGNV